MRGGGDGMRGAGRQAGMSLIEVLVAITILAIAMSFSLALYSEARKHYKKGENVIEEQQVVRIAYDVVSSDLRMAGFNHNPDGAENRVDEQIEAAYDTAVVIRADMDGRTAEAWVPEADLAGGAYDTVSTGNDEIVAYVLAKPDGSSTDVLSFEADVADEPRDGVVETVDIPGVALVQDDPPYTLYRITLNNDVDQYGDSDFFVRTPLADDIRSISFRYYDRAGNQLNAGFDLGDTSDDIGGAEVTADVETRTAIRRIGLELEGLTRDPDPTWRDPTDTDPDTIAHRKFELVADISPRNLGLRGLPDLNADLAPPAAPQDLLAVPGHCEGLYLAWTPNPPEDDVEFYRVMYGLDEQLDQELMTSQPEAYIPGLQMDEYYYVKVQAVDTKGSPSTPSGYPAGWPHQIENMTVPDAIQNVTATEVTTPEDDQHLQIDWDELTVNEDDLIGDPATPLNRDLWRYVVYRLEDEFADPVPADVIATLPPPVPPAMTSYVDTELTQCKDYWYIVRAEDGCGVLGASHTRVEGRLSGTVAPESPDDPQAFTAEDGDVYLLWSPVVEDEDGNPVYIERYKFFRTNLMPEGSEPSSDGDFYYFADWVDTGQPMEYIDDEAVQPGFTRFYQIAAVDECPNEARSDWVRPECAYAGIVDFKHPVHGDVVDAGEGLELEVEVENGYSYYETLTFEFHNLDTAEVTVVQLFDVDGSISYDDWAPDEGRYEIRATFTRSEGCSTSFAIKIEAEDD